MGRFLMMACLFIPLGAWGDEVVRVRSDSGQAEFRSDDLRVVVALLADYRKTLKEWDTPGAGAPSVETKTEFSTGDTVVPFVTFASRVDAGALLVDADLVMPDGTLSPSDHSPGVVVATQRRGDGRFYREESVFGFGISARYPSGLYAVRLKVYDAQTTYCVIEQRFQLR